jgi:hypothetical protein
MSGPQGRPPIAVPVLQMVVAAWSSSLCSFRSTLFGVIVVQRFWLFYRIQPIGCFAEGYSSEDNTLGLSSNPPFSSELEDKPGVTGLDVLSRRQFVTNVN